MSLRRLIAFVAVSALWLAAVRSLEFGASNPPQMAWAECGEYGVSVGLDGRTAWVGVYW